MAVLEVNFTRMELKLLKFKLEVAKKGHRLLKNKVDGMVKKVVEFSEQIENLKLEVFESLRQVMFNYELAKIEASSKEFSFLIANFKHTGLQIDFNKHNVMGVNLPILKIKKSYSSNFENLNFLMFSSSQLFNFSVKSIFEVFPKLVFLAEKEKSIEILKQEIKKTRRKVNALENLVIPNYVDTIKEIGLKLEENERNNIARLSRVKKLNFFGSN